MLECLLCRNSYGTRKKFLSLLTLAADRDGICEECKNQFQMISESHCPRCYKEGNSEVCKDCLFWESQGEMVCHESLYVYNEAMAHYFSCYKFYGDYRLRKVFEKEIRLYLDTQKEYAFVPIPVSLKRYGERGFNQVTGLMSAPFVPMHDILFKKEVPKQSEKTRIERLQLEQPFDLKTDKEVPEKILLLDDIYTTGATIRLAKELLMKSGAKKIKTFSLAR